MLRRGRRLARLLKGAILTSYWQRLSEFEKVDETLSGLAETLEWSFGGVWPRCEDII